MNSNFDNPLPGPPEIGRSTIKLSREVLPLEAPGFDKQRTERFWNMLVTTIPKTGYTPPSDRQTTVLDLACGICNEAPVLNAYFGGNNFGNISDKVRLVGVDINENKIGVARRRYGRFPNFEFYNLDATRLDEEPRIPKQADVAVIRHQEMMGHFFSDPEIWPRIFQGALAHTTPEGMTIITSYFDQEQEMLLETLGKLNCEIIVDEVNPFTDEPDRKISGDRHVTIVRKKQPSQQSDQPTE